MLTWLLAGLAACLLSLAVGYVLGRCIAFGQGTLDDQDRGE